MKQQNTVPQEVLIRSIIQQCQAGEISIEEAERRLAGIGWPGKYKEGGISATFIEGKENEPPIFTFKTGTFKCVSEKCVESRPICADNVWREEKEEPLFNKISRELESQSREGLWRMINIVKSTPNNTHTSGITYLWWSDGENPEPQVFKSPPKDPKEVLKSLTAERIAIIKKHYPEYPETETGLRLFECLKIRDKIDEAIEKGQTTKYLPEILETYRTECSELIQINRKEQRWRYNPNVPNPNELKNIREEIGAVKTVSSEPKYSNIEHIIHTIKSGELPADQFQAELNKIGLSVYVEKDKAKPTQSPEAAAQEKEERKQVIKKRLNELRVVIPNIIGRAHLLDKNDILHSITMEAWKDVYPQLSEYTNEFIALQKELEGLK